MNYMKKTLNVWFKNINIINEFILLNEIFSTKCSLFNVFFLILIVFFIKGNFENQIPFL